MERVVQDVHAEVLEDLLLAGEPGVPGIHVRVEAVVKGERLRGLPAGTESET